MTAALGALLCGLGLIGAGVLAPSGVAEAQSGLAAPTNLRTEYTQSRTIALYWDGVAGAHRYEYRVDGGSWINTRSSHTRYFVRSATSRCNPRCAEADRLVNGTEYVLQVRAVDSGGNAGAASAELIAMPYALIMSVAAGSTSGVNYLAWTHAAGSTGYEVQQSSNGVTGWTAMSPPHSGLERRYRHGPLPADRTYHYRVRAKYGATDRSGWSNVVTGTTCTAGTCDTSLARPMAAPTGVEVEVTQTAGGGARATVKWDSLGPEVVNHYRVEMRAAEIGPFRQGYDYAPTVSSSAAKGEQISTTFDILRPGQSGRHFEFRVQGRTTFADGTWSVPVAKVGGNLRRVSFAHDRYRVRESGRPATLELKLNADNDVTITVAYITEEIAHAGDARARAGLDYEGGGGTVTLGPGARRQTFHIPIIDENEYEVDELFAVRLTDVTNGALGDRDEVTVTIVQNDAPDLAVSNLGQDQSTTRINFSRTHRYAQGFNTGTDPDGYELHAIWANIQGGGISGSIRAM